jgi:hypothetical protein
MITYIFYLFRCLNSDPAKRPRIYDIVRSFSSDPELAGLNATTDNLSISIDQMSTALVQDALMLSATKLTTSTSSQSTISESQTQLLSAADKHNLLPCNLSSSLSAGKQL